MPLRRPPDAIPAKKVKVPESFTGAPWRLHRGDLVAAVVVGVSHPPYGQDSQREHPLVGPIGGLFSLGLEYQPISETSLSPRPHSVLLDKWRCCGVAV